MKALRILIADDNETDRLILKTIVRKEGHDPILAQNGQVALERFENDRPDLVLLDVMMPELDGMQVAQQIRSRYPDDYVPIIFLTSLQDAESLAQCLDSGGDDFLSKPYSRVILKAKIKAFGRMRSMHERLQEHNRQMLIEQQVAKTIFDNVAHSGCLSLDNIRYSLSPLAVFNGDTVLADRKPDGGMHLFLGDFTGHGLPAAIGAMPLAEIFYGMTSKGFAANEILKEINRKLCNILPTGVFCCGCFVELNFFEKTALVWNCGLPDAVIVRACDKSVLSFPSRNIPLGVLEPGQFNPVHADIIMQDGDQFLIWSDGIIEARNHDDQMFGEDRLHSLISEVPVESLFDSILSAVEHFVGDTVADDDVTLLTVKMVDIEDIGLPDFESKKLTLGGPQDWDFEYRLADQSLQSFNPLPLVLNVLTEVQGLRSVSGKLYTLVAEMYSNALEHGILALSSELKDSPEGFAKYYAERERRLAELESGFIKITITHRAIAGKNGGELLVSVEDSGAGFDHKAFLAKNVADKGYSGRGVPLIREITDEFYYNDVGNCATAKITWPVI